MAEYDNPDWSPDNAQKFTTDQLDKVDGPSDSPGSTPPTTARPEASSPPSPAPASNDRRFPPVTGQDAELAAIQRIVAGEQSMTIYKPIPIEAEKAAEVAVALVNGEDVGDTTDFEGVDSFIFDPVVVTQDNVNDTVIADGFYTVEDICTAEYADACAAGPG